MPQKPSPETPVPWNDCCLYSLARARGFSPAPDGYVHECPFCHACHVMQDGYWRLSETVSPAG